MRKIILALMAALAVLGSMVVAPEQAQAAAARTIVLMRATVDNKPAPTDADMTKMRSIAASATSFWSSKTGGAFQFSVSPTNLPTFNGNSYSSPNLNLVRQAAESYGYSYSDPSKVFVLVHGDTPSLMTAAMPEIPPHQDLAYPKHTSASTAGSIYLGSSALYGSNAVGSFAHELGHMLLLFHANSLRSNGSSLDVRWAKAGDSQEYGDTWDIMGPSRLILSTPTREILHNLPVGTKYLLEPPASSTFFDLRSGAIHFTLGKDSFWLEIIPGDGRINAVRVQRDQWTTTSGAKHWTENLYAYRDADVVPALTTGKTYFVGTYRVTPATNGVYLARR